MSAFVLKIIANLAMFIDHFAASARIAHGSLFRYGLGAFMTGQEHYLLLRTIGRIAFPIFAFQLVIGVRYTRSKPKYLLRLGIISLISEIPFDVALFGAWSSWKYQNVYFTLFLGLLSLIVLQWAGRLPGKKRLVGLLISAVSTAIIATTAHVLRTDYGYAGVIFIWLMGFMTWPEVERLTYPASGYARVGISAVAILLLAVLCVPVSGNIEFYALFALIPIGLYNGKKGYNKGGQIASYAFYPLHLIILGALLMLPRLLK